MVSIHIVRMYVCMYVLMMEVRPGEQSLLAWKKLVSAFDGPGKGIKGRGQCLAFAEMSNAFPSLIKWD